MIDEREEVPVSDNTDAEYDVFEIKFKKILELKIERINESLFKGSK